MNEYEKKYGNTLEDAQTIKRVEEERERKLKKLAGLQEELRQKKMVEDSSEPVTIITAGDESKCECKFNCPHCAKIIELRIQPTDKENIKL